MLQERMVNDINEYLYTEKQVREMWNRSKPEQISIAQAKCFEAISRKKGKVAVSFSGGKDSAVVLYLMAETWKMYYEMNGMEKIPPLPVFFADTTNEFICARSYREHFIEWIEQKFGIEIDYHDIKPDTNYFKVVDELGLPFVSKKVSRMVRDCRKTLKRLNLHYTDIVQYMPKHYTQKHKDEMIAAADKLRELGFNDEAVLVLTKITSANKISNQHFIPIQYRPLLDNDEFEISEQCCYYLKKTPIKKAQKEMGTLLPVTGEMAADSRDRLEAYRKTGCNLFTGERPKSKPLGPMTEQTVLWFIDKEEIPIMPAYGDLVYDTDNDFYFLTGEQRTGCKLCGFGLMYDKDRFIRLQTTEPKVIQFAFTSRENGGLGYRELCQFLNDKCKMDIGIPYVEDGYYERRATAYREKKEGEVLSSI